MEFLYVLQKSLFERKRKEKIVRNTIIFRRPNSIPDTIRQSVA